MSETSTVDVCIKGKAVALCPNTTCMAWHAHLRDIYIVFFASQLQDGMH
jgi:hypothetical protein